MKHINIIAELGVNHQGDIELMKKMMKVAKNCGVDYVKGQKRNPKLCLTKEQYDSKYDSIHSFGKTYGEHKEFLEFNKEEWIELFDYAKKINVGIFTSVFDIDSAKLMNNIGQKIFKIGSAEVEKYDLLEEIKSFNKPIILSTGMSTIEEIDRAVNVLKGADLTLMQCTSTYPCKEEDVNLNVLKYYKDRYRLPVGLSGHYVNGNGAIEAASAALGATWIERHFSLDRTSKGSDQSSSLEQGGLRNVVKTVRTVERAMGENQKKVLECELVSRKKYKNK